MSRSGYGDYGDYYDNLVAGRWRGQVMSAIRGKRGQAFFKELATAMDAMPVKRLITKDLVDDSGECCTMGVICKARKLDVGAIDPYFSEEVGEAIGIAHQLAAEIAYQNDECSPFLEVSPGNFSDDETPEQRWERMRKWVASQLVKP